MDFVFKIRGFDYLLVTEVSSFPTVDLNYSSIEIADVPRIEISGLLDNSTEFPEGIDFDEATRMFRLNGKLDFFAAIFFVLTRMEEYMNSEKDVHGRFPAEHSLLWKYQLLDSPVCDVWSCSILERVLQQKIVKAPIGFEPTFDIDNAFAFRHKSGIRKWLSYGRDVVKWDKKRLKERKTVRNGGQDPYDTYDTIRKIGRQFQHTRLFWLVKHDGKYDRNLTLANPAHQNLIQSMSESVSIGIHPSYDSFCDVEKVRSEKELLAGIVQKEISRSRQHFLRFSLPESYRVLIEAGITDDYSMGFAGACGFRCGTAHSFPWFDPTKNLRTDLMVHPFVYMDGTLNEYLHLSPEKSQPIIRTLYENVTAYGGTFRFIWHNETIGDYGKWKGWNAILNYTLSLHHE